MGKKTSKVGCPICEQTISRCFLKIDVEITHTTPRKSTVFEWLFLELLETIRKSESEYDVDGSLADILSGIFMIDGAQSLLMPTFRRLVDMGMISCEKLADAVTLSEIHSKDCCVLPLGKTMWQKGSLPSDKIESRISLIYDYDKKKVMKDKGKYQDECTGICNGNDTDFFPEEEIRRFLEDFQSKRDSKSNEKNQEWNWLRNETEIIKLSQTETERKFRNETVEVYLKASKDGLLWDLPNVPKSLKEMSLKEFSNDVPDYLDTCPWTAVREPENEITQILLVEKLSEEIAKRVLWKDCQICIVDANAFDLTGVMPNQSKNSDKALKIIIVSGAEESKSDSESLKDCGCIMLWFPEKMLDSGCLLMNRLFSVRAEKFPVSVGEVQRELTFGYIPKYSEQGQKEQERRFIEKIQELVERYCYDLPEVLLLLNKENGLEEKFDSYLRKIFLDCSIQEIDKTLARLNEIRKGSVSSEKILDFIFDREKISSAVSGGCSPKELIESLCSMKSIKNGVQRDCICKILCMIPSLNSLNEIWDILEYTKSMGDDIPNHLCNNEQVRQQLYPPRIMELLVTDVFAGKEVPDFKVEKEVKELHSLYTSLQGNVSSPQRKADLNRWKQKVKSFEKKYGIITSLWQFAKEIHAIKGDETTGNKGGRK